MAKKPYVINRLKQLNDNDNVVIVVYAYGMYMDDTFKGVNGTRNYRTKKDILDNISNPDWLYSKVIKEEKQTINNIEYLVLKASVTD